MVQGGRVSRVFESTVLRVTLGDVADADFQPGDRRDEFQTTIGPDHQMTHRYVASDGSRWPVSDDELSNIRTRPHDDRARRVRIGTAVGVGLILIGTGLWAVWRRRAARMPPGRGARHPVRVRRDGDGPPHADRDYDGNLQ